MVTAVSSAGFPALEVRYARPEHLDFPLKFGLPAYADSTGLSAHGMAGPALHHAYYVL